MIMALVTDEMILAALAAHRETRSSHPLNTANRMLLPGEMAGMQQDAMRNAIKAGVSGYCEQCGETTICRCERNDLLDIPYFLRNQENLRAEIAELRAKNTNNREIALAVGIPEDSPLLLN